MRGLFFIAISVICGLTAQAGAVHNVRFAQAATVMVWQDGKAIGQGAEVVIAVDGFIATAPFAGSGQLVSISDLNASAERQVRVKIASNSGFAIRAENPVYADQFAVEMVGVGINADPALRSSERLPGVIFQQSVKTAQRPGAPESQALELVIHWPRDTSSALEVVALAPGA